MPCSPVERRLLVVSPHPDDAALSVGGLLQAAAGWERHVGTLVGASDYRRPDAADSAGLAAISELRRREDERFAALAGVTLHSGDAPDAPLRDPLRGPFHVPSAAHVEELARAIDDWVRRLRPALLLAPLGIGGHADHLAARRASVGVALDRSIELLFYQDLPYAAWESGLGGAGRPSSASAGWVLPIGPHLAGKLACLEAYASQFEVAAMQRLVAAHALADGEPVERLWSPPGRPLATATARALGLRERPATDES